MNIYILYIISYCVFRSFSWSTKLIESSNFPALGLHITRRAVLARFSYLLYSLQQQKQEISNVSFKKVVLKQPVYICLIWKSFWNLDTFAWTAVDNLFSRTLRQRYAFVETANWYIEIVFSNVNESCFSYL